MPIVVVIFKSEDILFAACAFGIFTNCWNRVRRLCALVGREGSDASGP